MMLSETKPLEIPEGLQATAEQAENGGASRLAEGSSESSSASTPSITPMISQLWSNLTERASNSLLSSPSPASTIHIFGKSYQPEDTASLNEDILSRIWLTYRAGFEPIAKAETGPAPLSFINSMIFNRNISSTISNLHSLTDNEHFTTDVGWGCMIRTSQSLLANALAKVSTNLDLLLLAIVDMFLDNSSAPFSIHNFIKVAGELPLQVKPGEWFGPSAASLSIKRLCDSVGDSQVPQVFISESSDLYNDEISDLLTSGRSVLILLPIRLGIENISAYYYSSLFDFLTLPQSVGIAGGKPSSSYYFFGFQDSKLFYLDPHYPQQLNSTDPSSVNYSTYHTTRYLTLDIGAMDPSMMAGFLIKDLEDYQNFTSSLLDSKNKIIHFHGQREKERRSSTSQPDALSEDFSLSQVEMGDDDFVQIGEETENGFVDLGDAEQVKEEETISISREEGERKIDEAVNIDREEAKAGIPRGNYENE